MHWETHRFALPSIANYEWTLVAGTVENSVTFNEDRSAEYIDIKPRSISILIGEKVPQKEALPKQANNKKNNRKGR